MEYKVIDNKNIDIAVEIQKIIFPMDPGEKALRIAANNKCYSDLSMLKYWLVENKGKVIGICGLYSYKSTPKDVWLGWFGVLEDERGKGYGKEILNYMIQSAKDLGYENFRLYTDEIANEKAIKLYEKIGMTREEYLNPEDKHFKFSNTLIFSKSLVKDTVDLWNNKNLFLGLYE